MARPLRAFVSYRRKDAFMRGAEGAPDSGVLDRVHAALAELGFEDVFVDAEAIGAGDQFEGRIHRAILKCDVFIELIGTDWQAILDERRQGEERDVLQRELMAAFALDKDVVPLLVGGASMPAEADLPESIAQLAGVDAKSIALDASVEDMVAVLGAATAAASSARRLGRRWPLVYSLLALAAWLVCGVAPNIIGLAEFGLDAWSGMAAAWSGLFIWPVFFLPFLLLALYRPVTVLLEATFNADGPWAACLFASPIPVAAVLTLGITAVEISPPQVPWTVHPSLGVDCAAGAAPERLSGERQTAWNRDVETLVTFGEAGSVPERYADRFWMQDRCWPAAFFYLTVPVSEGHADAAYLVERQAVQAAFARMLGAESRGFKGTSAPYSTLFGWYAVSFAVMAFVLMTALLIAVIYTFVTIRRLRDGKVLRVPSEDTFLCLTFAFVTFLVWIPFRMTTNGVKNVYSCAVLDTCPLRWEVFIKDGALGAALLLTWAALSAGLLWKHRRVLLGVLGATLVAALVLAAGLVHRHAEALLGWVGYWQLWVVLSLLIAIVLAALWYQYDPALVRLREFRRYDERAPRR